MRVHRRRSARHETDQKGGNLPHSIGRISTQDRGTILPGARPDRSTQGHPLSPATPQGNLPGKIDLMLTYVENDTDFKLEFGDMNEASYNSLESVLNEMAHV